MGQVVPYPPAMDQATARRPHREVMAPHPCAEIVAATAALADIAARDGDLEDLLFGIAEEARRRFGVERCAIYLRDVGDEVASDEPRFLGRVASVAGRRDDRVRRLRCGGLSDRFTREIVARRRPVYISNARTDPRPVRAAMRAWDVHAMLGVPLILRDEVMGLLFLDDVGRRHHFGDEGAEFALAFGRSAAAALDRVLTVAALRAESEKSARQCKLLLVCRAAEEQAHKLVLDATSIEEVCDSLSRVLRRPCFAHDEHGRERGAGGTEEAAVRSVLGPDVPGSVVDAALAAVVGDAPAIVGPFPEAGLTCRYLIAPVVWRDRRGGHLVVAEHDRRFTAVDSAAVRRVAETIALVRVARRRAWSVRKDAERALVRDLIKGTGVEEDLRRRVANHSLDAEARFSVVLLRMRGDEPTVLDWMAVERAVARARPERRHLLAPEGEGDVVLLVPLEDGGARSEALQALRSDVERIVELLDGDVVAAVSSPCELPRTCPAAFEEARQVLRSLLSVDPGGHRSVLTSDELGLGRLLLGALDGCDAYRFAQQTLGALLEAEGCNGQLLRTIGVFFDHCRSVRRTAQELGVHENTIRYRLLRIQRLTGFDLAGDPDDQLSVQLALVILRLQGQILDREPVVDAQAPETALVA